MQFYDDTPYPSGNNMSIEEKMEKSSRMYDDEFAQQAVIEMYKNDKEVQKIKERIFELCKEIVETDPDSVAPSLQELRAVGAKLYDKGGICLMQTVADRLHRYSIERQMKTATGRGLMISGLCNSTWRNIGEWVC